jgi:hypothetical protein
MMKQVVRGSSVTCPTPHAVTSIPSAPGYSKIRAEEAIQTRAEPTTLDAGSFPSPKFLGGIWPAKVQQKRNAK